MHIKLAILPFICYTKLVTVDDEYDRKELYTPEANAERFKRVAERRVNRILNDLRLLGNTSNKSLYKYEPQEVSKIFDTLEAELRVVKSKFRSRTNKSNFRLD